MLPFLHLDSLPYWREHTDVQSWTLSVDVRYRTSTSLPQARVVDHQPSVPAWRRLWTVHYTMPLLWVEVFPGSISWKNNPHQKGQESRLRSYRPGLESPRSGNMRPVTQPSLNHSLPVHTIPATVGPTSFSEHRIRSTGLRACHKATASQLLTTAIPTNISSRQTA